MFTKTQELELVKRAKGGDEAAFTALIRPLREKVFWRAVRALRDKDQAEDVTQEAILRAFTRLNTFRVSRALVRGFIWLPATVFVCIFARRNVKEPAAR